jgi:hypothetical protein
MATGPAPGARLPLAESFADDFALARAVITGRVGLETVQDREFGPVTASDFVEALETGWAFIRPRSQLLLPRGPLRTGVVVVFLGEVRSRRGAAPKDDRRVRAMRAILATGKVPGEDGYLMRHFWEDIRLACKKTETAHGYSTKALRELFYKRVVNS